MSKMRVSYWLQAARPRAFPLAAACIGMGGVLAYKVGEMKPIVLGLAILTAVLLQLLSNLANDLGDFTKGADSADRLGPARTVQMGLISPGSMKRAIWIVGFLSFFSGLVLIIAARPGWDVFLGFLALGLLAMWAAIQYTLGKRPYGYHGLGDLFVFIFFGWVGVLGTYFLQTAAGSWNLLLPASSCGFFAVAVLNINNVRDIPSDRSAGKNTLAVYLGPQGARMYHLLLLAGGLMSAAFYTFWESDGNWYFMGVLPFCVRIGYLLYRYRDPQKIDPLLREMAFISLLFVMLFGLGFIL
jgi:1,4-dihydroxy-2-naphthoate octaprenyltransferase